MAAVDDLTQQQRAPKVPAAPSDMPMIAQGLPTRQAGAIYRNGSRFSDIGTGVPYVPTPSTVSPPSERPRIDDLLSAAGASRRGDAPIRGQPIAAGAFAAPGTGEPAKPGPLARVATSAVGTNVTVPNGARAGFSIDSGLPPNAYSNTGGVLDPARRLAIDSFLSDGAEQSNEARARQQFDLARSTRVENAISKRNSLENASREARIAAGSLRLVPGGRTQRMLLEKSLEMRADAAGAKDDIANLDFTRTPEQEAALASGKRASDAQGQILREQTIAAGIDNQNAQRRQAVMDQLLDIGQLSPDTRGALERYALISQGRTPAAAPAESFGNPVDEADANGNPIRAQYGDRGTRRVIDGVRPLPKANGGVTVGPDGTLVYSSNGPKLTEQQSKDLNYYTRGVAALKNMGDSDALADPLRKAGASVPLVGNALAGDEYQKAEQAGREFLASILRKDTGAAITNKEMDYYGKTYLPQPFDSAETLAQKAEARRTALEAIRSGMGPAQQLVSEDEREAHMREAEAMGAQDVEHGQGSAVALQEEIMAHNARRQKEKQMAVMDGLANIPESTDYSNLWK